MRIRRCHVSNTISNRLLKYFSRSQSFFLAPQRRIRNEYLSVVILLWGKEKNHTVQRLVTKAGGRGQECSCLLEIVSLTMHCGLERCLDEGSNHFSTTGAFFCEFVREVLPILQRSSVG